MRLAWDILCRGRYDFTFDLLPMHSHNMPLGKRANLLAGGLNLIYRKARPWVRPIHLKAELVNYCNLRCPVCPTGSGLVERPPQAMDLGLFELLMAEIGPYLLRVSLNGWGEPLLHPRFADAVAIARRYGVPAVIATNGQMLGDNRVTDELLREPPTYLTVAIDGLTDEVNSRYRTGARLEPALRGVRRLARRRHEQGQELPRLQMRFIVMKHNEHQLPDVRRFAVENGFDFLSLGALTIRNMDESPHRERIPGQAEFRAYDYARGHRVKRSDFVCQQAFLFATVLADGTVVACDDDFNARHAYGRIGDDGSFTDIWFGRRAAAVRDDVRSGRRSFSFCRNCPFADRPADTGNVSVVDLRRGGDFSRGVWADGAGGAMP